MNFWRIKWENIFGIITGAILISMTIKYGMLHDFDYNVVAFDLLYVVVSIAIVMFSVKATRKFYLKK